MPTDALIQKRVRTLRRLLAGEGKPYAEIDHLLTHGPRERLSQEWDRFHSMTKSDRDRLFAAADARKRVKHQDKVPQEARQSRRGRGPGKVPAGDSFTLVLPHDLLAQYRELAVREERPVAQLVRLAMRAYLATPSRLGSPEAVPAVPPEDS